GLASRPSERRDGEPAGKIWGQDDRRSVFAVYLGVVVETIEEYGPAQLDLVALARGDLRLGLFRHLLLEHLDHALGPFQPGGEGRIGLLLGGEGRRGTGEEGQEIRQTSVHAESPQEVLRNLHLCSRSFSLSRTSGGVETNAGTSPQPRCDLRRKHRAGGYVPRPGAP